MSMLNIHVFAFLCLVVTSDGCSSGFFGQGESCYAVVKVNASWAEAATYCSAVGAHLAVVESDAEQDFLKAHLIKVSNTLQGGLWIGGLDYLEEGNWLWGVQGGSIIKKYWGQGDPNNIKHGNREQDCIMLFKSSGFMWDDHFCSAKEYFLCEKEAELNPIG